MSIHAPIPEQPDELPGRPIAWISAGILVTIVACAGTVGVLVSLDCRGGGRSDIRELGVSPPADDLHALTPLERERAAQGRALDAWEWADRARGRVRVPVRVAIDRYLARRGAP